MGSGVGAGGSRGRWGGVWTVESEKSVGASERNIGEAVVNVPEKGRMRGVGVGVGVSGSGGWGCRGVGGSVCVEGGGDAHAEARFTAPVLQTLQSQVA